MAKFNRYHVTWIDDGEAFTRKFRTLELAQEMLAFIQTCMWADGKICDAQIIDYNDSEITGQPGYDPVIW
jgi:hypothetical protein